MTPDDATSPAPRRQATRVADFFKPLDKLAALVHGGMQGQTRGQGEVLPWFDLSAWMDAGMA